MTEPPLQTYELPTLWFAHWLRAVAVVLVVAIHLVFEFWTNPALYANFAHANPLSADVAAPFWVKLTEYTVPFTIVAQSSVGLFLLISGTVIPLTLENKTVQRFTLARVMRVMPIWIAATASIFLVFVIERELTGNPIAEPLYTWVANLFFVPDAAYAHTLNPPGWTLFVEVKFYALCALAAATIGVRRALPIAVFAVVGMAYAITVYGNQLGSLAVEHHRMWLTTQTLAWDVQHICVILAGVCFYNRLRSGWSMPKFVVTTAVCMGSAAVCAWQIDDPWPHEFLKYLGYVLALAVYALAFYWRGRVRPNRLVATIADISFPVYAIHFVLGCALLTGIARMTGESILSTIVTLAIIVAISIPMHRYVEKPGIRFGKVAPLPGDPAKPARQPT